MVATTSESTGVIVHTGERPTIQVTGPADRDAVCQIGGAIRGLYAVGIRDLVVDLSRMVSCDTRLLTALTRERARFVDTGGHLAIVGVQLPEILAALRAARLDEVFVIYDAMRRDNRRTITRARSALPRAGECGKQRCSAHRQPVSGKGRPASLPRGREDLRTHFFGPQDPHRPA